MLSKLIFTCLAAVMTVFISTAVFAADEYNVNNGLTLSGKPLGLHGYDPVAMFKKDAPELGNAEFTSHHDGVDYYFASAKTKDLFDADPASHLPQFGGFCAFGVFVGAKLDGDVRYADIVDGKLYLFVNEAIFKKYLDQKDEVIKGAHVKWDGIRSTAIGDL
ncbi:YHS domain-containing (seleno)protein [Cohaesibacter intestini]|uniref:YHS domain-containing (seleno)protein n=1 Tax=Cohaesibacter intestini TaxID=2211145 RepID=UPI000DEB4606|nr:YHS domain-containing (seleno)protein [Cohaesibacter intestini]